ncbi:glycosyltransferase [Fusobacterium ulcerans]|uniref:glycosyltransferase n=1 Tax=Fusobacterium ulcerans TaxID=861 RepID=UPI001D0AB198|nr:glycosyltransferase [Fusobacterium ulcerans]MCB8566263.1 glycosyltransferase [Fusobacterium ulcerans]MCB8650255.1 glycosyltransferase [Fusobacterium ulcerans]
MKILYIFLENEKNIGVRKKIEYQIKALSKLKNEVDKIYVDSTIAYLNDKILFNVGNRLLKRFILFFKLKKINLELYDLIYIRNPSSNPFFISFLKKIKNKKIIMEIPTYPYDNEADSFFLKVQNILDKVYRRKLKNYIQRIVTYSDDKETWGISCINISNGIDLDEIKLRNKKEIKNKIVFTSVSNCSIWHGIDRFIYSILEYIKNNGKEEIVFNIIGEGNETSKLKQIVKENKILENIVIFYGRQSGKELDKIYNITDIGIGSLGIHRISLETVQPLKNREYCAKGLPFIISFNDPDFINKEFIYKVSNNEKLFDIEKIIEWYKNLKITSKEIREYSKNFSWDIQMKKVVNYLKEGK